MLQIRKNDHKALSCFRRKGQIYTKKKILEQSWGGGGYLPPNKEILERNSPLLSEGVELGHSEGSIGSLLLEKVSGSYKKLINTNMHALNIVAELQVKRP